MLCVDELLTLELFQQLSQEQIHWVCDRAQEMELSSGKVFVKQGDPPRGFYVMLAGRVSITRISEGIEMPIGQHQAPTFFGEIQVLTDEPVPVTLRALSDCRLYEISGDDFRTLLHSCRGFERLIFQAVQKRLRGLESFIQNREKMAALGTLAAGLAHELNNPAAAVIRALQDITPALLELQRMNFVYGQLQIEAEHTEKWLKVRDDGLEAVVNRRMNPIEFSDREEQLLEWLEDYGVEDAWKLAEPLAAGGVEVKTLAQLTQRWKDDSTELKGMGLRWLALSFEIMCTVSSGLRGAQRISQLVQSMKSYSYMDRGAQQIVDVHDGIEDTLQLFAYKFKQGIEIQRNYDRSLPKILAFGSELNQVWTNLIDNAVDAIAGKGVIELATAQNGDYIQVQITDSGAGIPVEIQSRIFEPFYTTKPVGSGSGLGLDAVRRIVENRHQGTITFTSQPGKTCFTICLPIATHSYQ
ncbi:cyclic nucleotide-binding domain-containing protein [Chroococcidiopsis sp. FACHB-1243]|uniref:sensor histidine kinase n=1 Tax=Chroococcidiopsis sp. [FACHB-1243] TaxID=2692781 RepID=UPI001780DDF3|nr:ATP-binding protein [Chroococcidiopsis sp. [FACHB-1243]]MBD2304894.1 cyclic nucleotide-binding domain-containing protein [Chroococcidiopsis sp. [FACHB-1243]]